MKKGKQFLLVAAALFGIFLVPLFATGTVAAQASDQAACEGIGGNWNGGECTVAHQPNLEEVILRIIQVLSAIAGIAAVVMIIISGFRFIMANGDSSTVAAARRTLIYALVGLVVVGISQTLVWFVLRRVIG